MLSNSRGWQDWIDEEILQTKQLADDKLLELDFLASTHIQFFKDYVEKVKEDFEPVRVYAFEDGVEHTMASEPSLPRQSVFSPIQEDETFSTDGPSFASPPMTMNGSDPIQEMTGVREAEFFVDTMAATQDKSDLQQEALGAEPQRPVTHAVASLIKQSQESGVLEKDSVFATLPQRAPIPVKSGLFPPAAQVLQTESNVAENEELVEKSESHNSPVTTENQVEDPKIIQHIDELRRSFPTNRQRIHEAINSLRASKPYPSAKADEFEPQIQERPDERTQDEDEWVPRLDAQYADPLPEPPIGTPHQPKRQASPTQPQSTHVVKTPSAFDRAKAMLFGPTTAQIAPDLESKSTEPRITIKPEPVSALKPQRALQMSDLGKQTIPKEEETKENQPRDPAKPLPIPNSTQIQQHAAGSRVASPPALVESPPQVPPKTFPTYDRDMARQTIRQTKDFGFKVKQAPMAIRFATASQRELVDQRKTGGNPPPPVVSRPSKEPVREPSMSASRVSVSNMANVPPKSLASRPIKALTAASQARRKEEVERERKLMAKHELERRREQVKEERMKEAPVAGTSRLAATKKLAKTFIQKTNIGHEKRDVLGDVAGNAARQEEKKRPRMKLPGPPEKKQKLSDHEEMKSIQHVDVVKFSSETIKFDKERQVRPEVELPEIDSDYSDNESPGMVQARKDANPLPNWAESPALRDQLRTQEHLDPDQVFGAVVQPNLETLFSKASSSHRWRPRSSSANWDSGDRLTDAERHRYNLLMGYK